MVEQNASDEAHTTLPTKCKSRKVEVSNPDEVTGFFLIYLTIPTALWP
jgi:hypothetical protein